MVKKDETKKLFIAGSAIKLQPPFVPQEVNFDKKIAPGIYTPSKPVSAKTAKAMRKLAISSIGVQIEGQWHREMTPEEFERFRPISLSWREHIAEIRPELLDEYDRYEQWSKTIPDEESDRSWHAVTEHLRIKKELEKMHASLENLNPLEQDYIHRKKAFEHEINGLTVPADKAKTDSAIRGTPSTHSGEKLG